MIRRWTKADLEKKIGTHSTVGKFYVNKALPYILLDDKLVSAVEKMETHFGAVFCSQSINSVFALASSGSHVGKSQHYYGRAIDIALKRPDGTYVDTLVMARFAETLPERLSIGLYRKGNKHIHIDTRPGNPVYWWIVTSNSRTPSFGGVFCVYKLGHRSPMIEEFQTKLKKLGYYTGTLSGEYNAATKTAFIALQKAAFPKNPKEWDGVAGKNTQAALATR